MQLLDAQAVANRLLDAGDAEQVPISPMKLQKLVYFAHGWHLAVADHPLLNERIEAWKFGPVIPSLYHDFKEFGDRPITSRAFVVVGLKFKTAEMAPDTPQNTRAIIQRTWEVYRGYTPLELSAMTHQPGTPWDETIKRLGGAFVKNADIDDELIKKYFKGLIRPVART